MLSKITAAAAALTIMFGTGYMMRNAKLPEINSSSERIFLEVSENNDNIYSHKIFNKTVKDNVITKNLPMITKSDKTKIQQLPAKKITTGGGNKSDFQICLL